MTGSQINIIFLVASFSILIFFISFAITNKLTEQQRKTAKRLEDIVGKEIGTDVILTKVRHGKKKKANKKDYKERKSIISKIGEALFEQLMAADIVMKADEFATLWVMLAFFPSLFCILIFENYIVGIALALIGSIGPIFYVKFKRNQRTKKFEAQLADTLMICANSLKSGLSFPQAMETVARDMLPPISSEFDRAVREMNMGVSMDEALENIQMRVKSNEFKIAVIAVAVQKQTGGNLSSILETIANTLKERFELKKEIAAVTATGRLSGSVVAVLPVGVAFLMNVVEKGYISNMWETDIGKILLIAAVILECIGVVVIKKITTIKY